MLCISSSAYAVLTITAVGGVSNYAPPVVTSTTPTTGTGTTSGSTTNNGTTTSLPIIYGGLVSSTPATTGFTGLGGCANPDGVNPCSSCDGTNDTSGTTPLLKACNQKSIYPNLKLSVTLTTDGTGLTGGSGTPQVLYQLTSTGTTTGAGGLIAVNPQPALSSGASFTVTIPWTSICQAAASDANCMTPFTSTLTIGIENDNSMTNLQDKIEITVTENGFQTAAATEANTACPSGTSGTTGEGICDFSVTRGDQKVYVDNFQASDDALTVANSSTGLTFTNIVMFYAEVPADGSGDSVSGITNASSSSTLTLQNNQTSAPGLADARIRGLTNGSRYCFVLGNQDITGNIYYFNDGGAQSGGGFTAQCATPTQVVGLLDDKHCFIATATYGSVMAPEVETFRQFRNRFLLTNQVGIAMVHAYYHFGPVAAEWISHSPVLRTMSLVGLWPLLMFAKLSLYVGIWAALGLLFLLSFGLSQGLILLRHRARLRGER